MDLIFISIERMVVMGELSKLQEELKKILLEYEEKASSRIDNKHQIKQFNALVRNEDISEELINFIIDTTDEINTRHFEFVDHTTKTIRDIGDITHRDIEKLKYLMDTTLKKKDDEIKDTKNKLTEKITPWYDFTKWSISDAKFFIIIILVSLIVLLLFLNSNNIEFLNGLSSLFDSVKNIKGK